MQKRVYDTIIIGAGISGIGCAHRLLDNDYHDFKIISPAIGGRIIESDDKTVEYGAYYVMDIYHNTASFVEKGRRIRPTRLMFHNKKHTYRMLSKKVFTHLGQLLKLIMILRRFKRHYEKFKDNSLYESQIACLKKDDYLWDLYHKNAEDFVSENKIDDIVYDYMAEVLHGTAFAPVKDLNAFTFLHFSLPLIVPIYEFIFRKEMVRDLIRKNYVEAKVTKVVRKKDHYEILTSKRSKFLCKNLVAATPPHISKKLLNIRQPLRRPANAHMFHLIGDIRDKWNDADTNLFSEKSRMLAIAHQHDNSYLFYSADKNPDFSRYFFHYKIIKYRHWKPAFNIKGDNLVDFEQGKNLYMIGDNNVCGLEPAYIYGMYAANKILGKTKD